MELQGWIMMFIMLTVCSWAYHNKVPLKLFRVSMLITGTLAFVLTLVQVAYKILC